MNYEDLTIREAKGIALLFKDMQASLKIDYGFCLVIFEQGFIYVGEFEIDGEFAFIRNARNLRKWNSGKGLQWHVENGSKDTVLDGKSTDWKGFKTKIINWASTDKEKWN